MPPPVRFSSQTKLSSPSWLQRFVGGGLMESLGEVYDTLVDRTVQSIQTRWPGGGADDFALSYIGRDRLIIRGPAETSEGYSARLRRWWDANARRGGPYELLLQMRGYFRGYLDVPITLLYYSGRRYQMPADAETDDDIVRDDIVWGGDGSGAWAQIWIFFDMGAVVPLGDDLTTEDGDSLTTEDGDAIFTDRALVPEDITGYPDEVFIAAVKPWLAAHVLRATLVFTWSNARLWGGPEPIGTWGAPEPPDRTTWAGDGDPVVIEIYQGI